MFKKNKLELNKIKDEAKLVTAGISLQHKILLALLELHPEVLEMICKDTSTQEELSLLGIYPLSNQK